ncbi:YafY family transcriptional regulator [candidate division KSB1 bacterium]|nr:YafY family transcriptional regulator [candidate division KSB1 bacterium]
MNRLDRLVAILLLLQSQRVLRAREIADHFSICVRTVYRDLKALEEAGVPLSAEAGIGYSLVKGYHLPPVMFTHEEASALTIGGKFVEKLTDSSLQKNMHSALLKIYSVLPRDKQIYLNRLQETTSIIPRTPPDTDTRSNIIIQAQEAIARQKILEIDYFANYNKEKTTRKIEPVGLLYYADNWHLIAWCRLRKDYRDFRLSRIRKLNILDADFLARPGFSLAEYARSLSDVKNAVEVKVKFLMHIKNFIRNREFFGFVEEKIEGDVSTMTFLVDSLRWMAHWLLSYGGDAEVISPDSLKEMMIEEAQKILELYTPNTQ